ncbi:MAG: OB-fold nucleic acid binding domain-containing protein, partial [Eubacteriales bacterium]
AVEVRRRGVEILPPDINLSYGNFTVEGGAIRISLRQVKGVKESALDSILEARSDGLFKSFDDFRRRTSVDRNALENMVACGVFDTLHPNRKQLLWAVSTTEKTGAGEVDVIADTVPNLIDNTATLPPIPDFTPREKFNMEYEVLGIDICCHYMSYWRSRLDRLGFTGSRNLSKIKAGSLVKIAGLPIRPHRPPTRTGKTAAFFSLEDEFGLIDVTVFEKTYQRFGALLFTKPVPPLQVWGTLQYRGNGVSVIARKIERLV